MQMKGWRGLFEPHILERGKEYFEDGLVDEIIRKEDQVSAVVCGSEDYDVEIGFMDGDVADLYCSCPYAERGENCKHMAAVLFALEDGEWEAASEKSRKEIEELVDSVPEVRLRELLVELAMKDDSICRKLKAARRRQENIFDIEEMFEEAVQIAKNHQDDYDSDDGEWWEEDCAECEEEFRELLEHCIWPLLEQGRESEVFDLTVRIANYLEEEFDEFDALGAWIDGCAHRWHDMLCECEEELRIRRFEQLMNLWEHGKNHRLEEVLRCELCKEQFLRRKLMSFRKEIASAEKRNGQQSPFFGWLLRDTLNTMHELKISEEELSAFYGRYMDYAEVCKDAVEHAKALQQYDKAICLLKKGIASRSPNNCWKDDYWRELIELCSCYGKTGEYEAALKEYVFTRPQQELTYIWRLKGLMEWSEWEETREKIFSSDSCRWVRLDLMEAECLYGRLSEEVIGSGSIEIMLKYDKALRPLYNSRLKEAWFHLLDKRMSSPTDRGTYREIIRLLKQLAVYPGGEESVKQLVSKWRAEYRRRSAMLDELKRAGY